MALPQTIKIPYGPRSWAMALHNAAARWIVLIIHRRGGKTTASFNHLQRDALRYPETRYAYVAPTYKQAKRIVWSMAKFYARDVPGVKFNTGELLIHYANGSEIMIVGSDNPDSLRGIALWGAFLDEYPQQSPIIFTEIITKCLADHEGYCIFGGTPKGKGHFFRIYQTALKNPDRWVLVYKTIDESLVEEKGPTIEALRRSLEEDRMHVKDGIMTEDEFQQEWYNSFEAAVKGAVYLKELAQARKENRVCGGLYDPTLPVFTVWDLGVSKSDAMAVGFFQRVGKEIRLIDYLETLQTGLPGTIKTVKDKPYIYAKHFAPHDIRNREVGTGKTRQQTAAQLGMEFEVIPKLGIDDGIDLGRTMFQRLFIDRDRCELFLDFIGAYHYDFDEKRGIFTKLPVHDFTSHCFTGDTIILTRNGMYPIMDLPTNGEVLTKKGWRKYKNLRKTRENAKLVEVSFQDGMMVRCTPDHLFLTDNGWKSAEQLTKGLMIQSSLTPLRSILTVFSIVYGLVKHILVKDGQDSIEMFGKKLLVLFQVALTFIIKMAIRATTCFIILSVWMQKNIYQIIGKQEQENVQNTSHNSQEIKQENGINPKKEGYGIKEIWKRIESGKSGLEKTENVQIVSMYSKHFSEKVQLLKSIVLRRAKPCIIENVCGVSYLEDVWDMEVEDTHHFSLSNGAIVHNCADMYRYAAVIEDEMTIEKYAPPPRVQLPDDEYVGQEDPDDYDIEQREGMGKHPMMRGINIGALGHKPK